MEPTIGAGQRYLWTLNDLRAFDYMGYKVVNRDNAPSITNVTANLEGNTLTVTGTVNDPDSDLVAAEVTLLDAAGLAVTTPVNYSIPLGSGTAYNFSYQITGLNQTRTATQASIKAVDYRGNKSGALNSDFTGADAGGPTIASVKVDTSTGITVIKGTGFTGTTQIEVNGVVVAPPVGFNVKPSSAKIKIRAVGSSLGLTAGSNRVRVISNGHHSNIFNVAN
jgi:hypothetical protein